MNALFYSLFIAGLFLITTQEAQAYLDPGSGSLLFQLLVGGVLSGLFAIKLYYKKIKSFFNKKNIDDHESEKNQ